MTIRLYEISTFFNETLGKTHFNVVRKTGEASALWEFSSSTAGKLYAADGDTVLGYE